MCLSSVSQLFKGLWKERTRLLSLANLSQESSFFPFDIECETGHTVILKEDCYLIIPAKIPALWVSTKATGCFGSFGLSWLFFFDRMEGKDVKRVIVFDFGVKVSVSFKSVRKSRSSLGINEHY